jgi:hypothetical protein
MSMATMAGTQSQLENAFSPAVLESVRSFWFQNMKDEHFILPTMEIGKRWFRTDEVFDNACVWVSLPITSPLLMNGMEWCSHSSHRITVPILVSS